MMKALNSFKYDVVIIGAGIVGMTTALELKRRMPLAKIAILDKESRIGVHASGRNSGVLHSGIYYANDTLKAKLCASGAKLMMAFADDHQIPYRRSGKIIVATHERELSTIDKLMRNAEENGINAKLLDLQTLLELEPEATKGPAAIYCPDTAVIDGSAVINKLQELLRNQGVSFNFECKVLGAKSSNEIMTSKGIVSFGFLFNCAGAYADKIARYFGLAENYALIPFKGMYWKLTSEASSLVRSSIYPVPDVSLPFLGVHLTRSIHNEVYVGPTAMPVLGRENYQFFEGIYLNEVLSISARLISMYLKNQNNFRLLAKTEMAKYTKKGFLSAAKKLLSKLELKDLIPTSKAGIRPQLVNIKTQKLEMDYILEKTVCSIHVLNSISPAFTSGFAFSKLIVNESGII